MSTTVSSAFAPLFPLDIRTFKGKLIMVVGITTFSALLVLFTVLFILGYNKALTGCADKVLFWWIGSLIQEALLLILYSLFAFYIWKTSPSTSTGREIYSDKKDPIGFSLVLSYLIVAAVTIGWGIVMIAYLLIAKISCIGTVNYVAAWFWIPITILTAVLPTRVWSLLFFVPWKRICRTTY